MKKTNKNRSLSIYRKEGIIMSAFLAPIHTWLFNKILLAEELEKSLNEVYIENYKDAAKYIVEKSIAYGSPIDITKNIEDIINITGLSAVDVHAIMG